MLVFFRKYGVFYVPVDVQVGVVPADAAFRGFVIDIGAFVKENSIILQGHETMRETGWHPIHHFVRLSKLDRCPLAVGW